MAMLPFFFNLASVFLNLLMNWKNTAISSIKIRFNIARRICYLDSRCTLTVMIPEIMPRSIYSKKIILNNLNWIIACSHINRFLEFAINHEKQLEFQSIMSEILGHHYHGWPRHLHFKLSYRFICWRNSSLTVCYYHVKYAFQSASALYNCLNAKELFAQNRRHIWSLSDSSGKRTHNHLTS